MVQLNQECPAAFQQFAAQYGKRYSSEEEREERYNQFCARYMELSAAVNAG